MSVCISGLGVNVCLMLVYGGLAVICGFGIADWLLSGVGSLLVVSSAVLVRGAFAGFCVLWLIVFAWLPL